VIGGHAWSRAAIPIASHLYAELYVENGEPHESRINPTEVAEGMSSHTRSFVRVSGQNPICPMRRPRHLVPGLNNNTRDFTELLIIDVAAVRCVSWFIIRLSRVVGCDPIIAVNDPNTYPTVCNNCLREFLKKRPWHRHCSDKCRYEAHRKLMRSALRHYRAELRKGGDQCLHAP
jgi:hypothetical protein